MLAPNRRRAIATFSMFNEARYQPVNLLRAVWVPRPERPHMLWKWSVELIVGFQAFLDERD
jgi:hypothetical protein